MKSFIQEGIPVYSRSVSVATSGVAITLPATAKAAVITDIVSAGAGTLNEFTQTGAVICYIPGNSNISLTSPIKVADSTNVFANLSSGTICYYLE